VIPPGTLDKGMRLLVAGGRDWRDEDTLRAVLDALGAGAGVLIEGCAPGADQMAETWARDRGITIEHHPANWGQHGGAAGPLRNQAMIDSAPDLVIAFPGGRGTLDLVRRALRAHVPTLYIHSGPRSKTELLAS
jgi:cysteine synthase